MALVTVSFRSLQEVLGNLIAIQNGGKWEKRRVIVLKADVKAP